MSGRVEPYRVFISYAPEDEGHLQELEKHLGLLKQQGQVSTWNRRKLRAGDLWMNELCEQLIAADLILLLMSPDFLASEHTGEEETRLALERRAHGKAQVVPIKVRPVDLEGKPWDDMAMLPSNGNPVTLWRNWDEAWWSVVRELRHMLHLAEAAPQEISILQHLTHWSRSRLEGRQRTYPYVERRIEAHIDAFLNHPDKNIFVVADIAGAGKSHLLCHKSLRWTESAGRHLIFLDGASMPSIGGPTPAGGTSSGDRVAVEMGLLGLLATYLPVSGARQGQPGYRTTIEELAALVPTSSEELLAPGVDTLQKLWGALDSCVAPGGHLIFVFDAVNEWPMESVERRKEFRSWILRVSVHKRIKIIISCRHEAWNDPDTGLKEIFLSTHRVAPDLARRLYRCSPDGQEVADDEEPAHYGSAPLGVSASVSDNTGLFSETEFALAWEAYCQRFHIEGKPVLGAMNHLRHPLHLRFFCEAHQGTGEHTSRLGDISRAEFWTTMQLFVSGKRDEICLELYQALEAYVGGEEGRSWSSGKVGLVRNELGELARFATLSFAHDLYASGLRSFELKATIARFMAYIARYVARVPASTPVGQALRRHEEMEKARVNTSNAHDLVLPYLLESFVSSQLLNIYGEVVATADLRRCMYAVDVYYEYCLGRYLASEGFDTMMAGVSRSRDDSRRARSSRQHASLGIKALMNAHLKGHPNIGEALRYAALAREHDSDDYIDLLRTMASTHSRFHGLVCSTVQELAVIKHGGCLNVDVQQQHAIRLGKSLLPLKLRNLYDGSPRLKLLLDGRSRNSGEHQRRVEIGHLIKYVLEPVADGGDFVSRFELQSALAAVVQSDAEVTLSYLRRWITDPAPDQGWTKTLTKILVAIETLPELNLESASALTRGLFSMRFGPGGNPYQMRFWIWRAGIEAMVEICRRELHIEASRPDSDADVKVAGSGWRPVEREFSRFVHALIAATESNDIREIERGLLLEGIVRLVMTGLVGGALDEAGARAIHHSLCTGPHSWARVAILLAIVEERAYLSRSLSEK